MSCILGACIVAAQLTHGGTYTEETSLYAIDTNNITHDISKFYEVNNTQFKLGGYAVLNTDTRIDLSFDNGLESQKRSRGKALTVGITQLSVISENSHITYGMSTKLGGRVSETSCTDDSGISDKEFFCDNLQTLESFSQPKNNRAYKVSVNYSHKFNWFLGTK